MKPKRKLSGYQKRMSVNLKKLQRSHPNMDNKLRFKKAAAMSKRGGSSKRRPARGRYGCGSSSDSDD
jgi:hypothetical protein